MANAPTEAKVYAGTIGTGLGATAGSFAVWLLGVLVWGAPSTADEATKAIGAVPAPVAAMVFLLITVGSAFYAGWAAKHTPRPQPDVDPAPVAQLPDIHGLPPIDPRDLDGDGRDDTTGRFT